MQLPKFFHGGVVEGQGRGRRLGFPTANLRLQKNFPPAEYGVYAGWVWVGGQWRAGVAHIGPAASFGEGTPRFEVHILGWSGDLYGQGLTVQLLQKIRATKIFPQASDLEFEIQRDIIKATQLLRSATPPVLPPNDA